MLIGELESFIIIPINKTIFLIWNLKQQMFTMNDKNQSPDVVNKKGHTRKVRPGTQDLSHGTFHLGSFYVGCGT